MSEGKYRVIADEGMGSISAVVGTLPAAFNLGEAREYNRVEYVLCHNAGNSEIGAGRVATPILAGAGPYSMTVSTASQGNNHIGGVVVQNTTVPTANYFWGAKRGLIAGMVGDSVSIPTGNAMAIGDNGSIQLMPQSVVTGKVAFGLVITTVSNGGARSGTCFINFA